MTMISDLPSDLETEILSRVPANFLWELKTTCKRWYALFRDPRFVEKNKKLSKAVRESIILSNHGDVYSIDGDLHNTVVNTPIEVSGKLTSLKGSKDLDFSKIFHCDGLMLFSNKGNTRLVVWNPCTGQRRKIKPRTRYRSEDTFSLGYSKSSSSGSHCYKILKYCCYRNNKKVWVAEGEIYELSSDSWRVLDSCPLDYAFSYCDGMSLKGDTYFVVRNNGTGAFFMKFDFTRERFERLPLPFQTSYIYDRVVLSVVRDEKLSVLHSDHRSHSHVMRIWVSNKLNDDANREMSWRSDLVLDERFNEFSRNINSFLLDEENKVAVLCSDEDLEGHECKSTIVYMIGNDMLKQVYVGTIKPSRHNSPLVITYVPSLVRI